MRQEQLKDDLLNNPIELNHEQKTILNHYIRTPVAIISGHLENIQQHLNLKTYNLIKEELNNIINTVEQINNSNSGEELIG